MKRAKYQALRVLAVLVMLAASTLLSLILFWLTFGHGVIGCGKGIFDSPTWPLDGLVFVGVPAGLIVGSIALARHCSSRQSLR